MATLTIYDPDDMHLFMLWFGPWLLWSAGYTMQGIRARRSGESPETKEIICSSFV